MMPCKRFVRPIVGPAAATVLAVLVRYCGQRKVPVVIDVSRVRHDTWLERLGSLLSIRKKFAAIVFADSNATDAVPPEADAVVR